MSILEREPESGVSQSQGKFPPGKRRAKAPAGAGYPESGTMRPTVPPAPDGMPANDPEPAQPAAPGDDSGA